MTEEEYKELQKWCSSKINQGTEEYNKKRSRRNEATDIRRQICFYKTGIKKAMFVLEACKSPSAIAKWKNSINEMKQKRNEWTELFKIL